MLANSSRRRLELENAAFARATPRNTWVLDAGCGEAPYRILFPHCFYESADFCSANRNYVKPTYECDLAHIPVKNNRYDAVLFNQVMEHLPEPAKVLAELYRVMKPGARMIYTAPLFFEPHEEPYDFYRYTQYGARHLLESAGFEVERMDWLEGYFGTVAYQMTCMAKYLPWTFAPVKFAAAAGAVLFHWLEVRWKYMGAGHPKNYVAVVRKVGSIGSGTVTPPPCTCPQVAK
jgi:SAM-dependent methyltransferase